MIREFGFDHFVVHKYGRHRAGRLDTCKRCGVKRRKTSSGWQWRGGRTVTDRWTTNNPLCIPRPVKL